MLESLFGIARHAVIICTLLNFINIVILLKVVLVEHRIASTFIHTFYTVFALLPNLPLKGGIARRKQQDGRLVLIVFSNKYRNILSNILSHDSSIKHELHNSVISISSVLLVFLPFSTHLTNVKWYRHHLFSTVFETLKNIHLFTRHNSDHYHHNYRTKTWLRVKCSKVPFD